MTIGLISEEAIKSQILGMYAEFAMDHDDSVHASNARQELTNGLFDLAKEIWPGEMDKAWSENFRRIRATDGTLRSA